MSKTKRELDFLRDIEDAIERLIREFPEGDA